MEIAENKCVSRAAVKSSEDLIQNLKNKPFLKDPLMKDDGLWPREFSEWEMNNYLSFLCFTESRRGKIIMDILNDSSFCDLDIKGLDEDVLSTSFVKNN